MPEFSTDDIQKAIKAMHGLTNNDVSFKGGASINQVKAGATNGISDQVLTEQSQGRN